jgi:hypothetical protein
MKHVLLLFAAVCCLMAKAGTPVEQILISENFQGWAAQSASTTEKTVGGVTYYGDSVHYTYYNVAVMPTYTAKGDNGVTSVGAIQTQKVDPASSYFIVSGFPSVTKAIFKHSYTGGSRGCTISAKGDGDADWIVLLSANTTAAAGQLTSLDINKTNVSLRFQGNIASQNAYLHDLIVYGLTDKVVPVLVSSNYVNGDLIPYQGGSIKLVFSEKVTRGTGAVTLGGTTIPESDIVITDSLVTINYGAIPTDASYVFAVPAGAFKNMTGTPNAAIITYTYKTLDTVNPALSKISISDGARMPVNGFISLVMSEACKAGGSVQASLGIKSITPAISSSNANLVYVNYSGLDYDKDYTLTIPSGAVTDLTGNVYSGTSLTFHTEMEAKGDTLISFIPTASTVPSSASGVVKVKVAVDSLEFGGVASAGARSAESFTYSFKTNYILLPELPSLGELSMYIQCGGGTVPQEYYVQKYNSGDGTWSTIETVILGTNDRVWFRSAAAQSSVPVKLRIQYKDSQLWFYALTAYAYKKVVPVDDGKNPTVVMSVPSSASSKTFPINGSIKLTFSENVVVGTGDIVLNGKVLIPGILDKIVTLPYVNLKYSTGYTVDIPAGAFKDEFGNPSDAYSIAFRTRTKPAVEPKLFDFVVSQGGHGNGTTIQSAFDAVPAGNTKPYIIFVLPGIYNERPTLAADKTNVCMIGVNRDAVIITGDKRSGVDGFSTSTCQTMEILADNFYCENMTIRNTAGLNAGQAVALKVYADKAVFKNIKLTGYQDTHLTANNGSDRQYYLDCEIHGSVDFIFGNGTVFFDESLIYMEDRSTADVIVAPSTDAANIYGYVFSNCTIDGASSQDGSYNLGRPWQNSPRAVYLNTKMNILPSSGAWISMGTIPALFAEYGSVNASNNPVDVSGRNTLFSYTSGSSTISGSSPKAVLTAEEAAVYTRANVLGGSDSWVAETKTEATAAPSNLKADGANLTWDAVEGAICYGIRVDNSTFFSTTTNSVQLVEGSRKYYVVAYSEYGAMSDDSEISVDYNTNALNDVSQVLPFIKNTIVSDYIEIINGDAVKSVEVFNVDGSKMLTMSSGKVSSLYIKDLQDGFYIVALKLNNGKVLNTKIIKK